MEKILNQNVILLGLKIINEVANVKNLIKKWSKRVNEFIKKFPRIYQFFKDDLNKFVLLLRKGVYPYKYMDSWQKFGETTENTT